MKDLRNIEEGTNHLHFQKSMAFIYEINFSQILTLYPVGKKPKSLKNNLQKNSRGEVMESGGTRVEVVGRFNIKDFEDFSKRLS